MTNESNDTITTFKSGKSSRFIKNNIEIPKKPLYLRSSDSYKELIKLFFKISNVNGKVTVAKLYNFFLKSNHFKNDANDLYHEFHFKLNSELSLTKLIELLNDKKEAKGRKISIRHNQVNLSTDIGTNNLKDFKPFLKNKRSKKNAIEVWNINEGFDFPKANNEGKDTFDEPKAYNYFENNRMGLGRFTKVFSRETQETTSEMPNHKDFRKRQFSS